MNISSLSINRPVLASVLSIVVVLFGIIGFTYLGVREYPSVDPPIVTVSTNYTGANSDVIEAQITEPLEASINGIAGIKSITSSSSDGSSSITIEFDLGIDMESAANDVRDRVSRAIRNLPPDADPPIVTKADANAETILAVTVQSKKRSLLELTDIANNVIKERLQTIPGVSQVNIWGEKRYAMRLYLDPRKLASFNLTPSDIRNALSRENVELPTGKIEGYYTELSIRTLGRLETPEQFNNLIIKDIKGIPIRLKDVGEAGYGAENEKTLLRGNGLIPMFATKEQYATLEQMGDLSLQMAVEDAVSSTILGYYTIVQEEKLKDNYREVLNLSRTRLNIAREKADIGAGYQLAAMQADVDFRADSAQLLQQSNKVQNLKVNLNKLMGRDPETVFEVAPAMPESQTMALSRLTIIFSPSWFLRCNDNLPLK